MQALEPRGILRPMSRKQWGHGNVYLRGKTWWLYYSDHGRMVRESSHSKNKDDANKQLKRKLAAVSHGEDLGRSDVRVDELLDDLLQDYEINGKSLAWAKIVVAHLRPHFGRYLAVRIGTAQVNSYILRRRGKGIANGTINRELALLRSAFYMGHRSEPAKVSRVPFIAKLKEAEPRKGFFEAKDFDSIAKHLPPDIADIALFAREYGCRRSEIPKIQWTQVDFANRSVRLEAGETKNDDARTAPMTTAIYEMLWRRKRERDKRWPGSPWAFSRSGEPIKSFKAAWEAACVEAKLGGLAARLFHDLRRTAVRNMIRAGVPEKVAMLISGHRTRSVFDRYHIIDESDLREAARKIDRYKAAGDGK